MVTNSISKLFFKFFPNFIRVYPGLTGNLCMNFDECRCKGKAVMSQKTIFNNQCIVTFTLTHGKSLVVANYKRQTTEAQGLLRS